VKILQADAIRLLGAMTSPALTRAAP